MFCFVSMAGSLSDSSSVAHVLVAGDVHPPEAGEPGQLSRVQISSKGFVPSQAQATPVKSSIKSAPAHENSGVKWKDPRNYEKTGHTRDTRAHTGTLITQTNLTTTRVCPGSPRCLFTCMRYRNSQPFCAAPIRQLNVLNVSMHLRQRHAQFRNPLFVHAPQHPMRKLTRSQYLKAWGDLIGNADVKPERLRLDDLTHAHPGDPRVAGHVVARPLIPSHAMQPVEARDATHTDNFLSSRNLLKIEKLYAALAAEQASRSHLEEQLARVRGDAGASRLL